MEGEAEANTPEGIGKPVRRSVSATTASIAGAVNS